ncbi:hypothetical protein EJ08DRAFT_698636 [Tothia fuscella]|uniref:Flavin-nucleotide-binding protein n=1 Tax=Tothia fuscella TaxID=1048955 RepID=A0A9P4NNF7_9PEZI|nr:hypothetical protein EJ08DRAFT_698636 [Tothia fuscella]
MEPAYLRREKDHGSYDIESIKSVFDDCFIAHVSYVDDGMPACLPMVALVRSGMDDEGQEDTDSKGEVAVYLHGPPSARLMELVRKANRDDGEGDESNVKGPIKVCISATKVDGLILSSAPNGHTFNYRSAIIHGTCFPLKGKDQKRKVMHDVTNHILANRWEELNPVASFQVNFVYVIKVRIDRMSLKTRTGTAGIQPRNVGVDGPDVEIKPWTGVVPLYEVLGKPVESGLSDGAVVSENLRGFVEGKNRKEREYAERVARPE